MWRFLSRLWKGNTSTNDLGFAFKDIEILEIETLNNEPLVASYYMLCDRGGLQPACSMGEVSSRKRLLFQDAEVEQEWARRRGMKNFWGKP